MPAATNGSWYDLPQYYDLAFRDGVRREARFIQEAARRYCDFPVTRMLEPACGTGRLLRVLARRGYDMVGLDLNRSALDFLAAFLKRNRLKAELIEGDMAAFTLERPVDLAFNTLNGFRHLLTEEEAVSHLCCVGEALRPGGLYILGMHLWPPDADEAIVERWKVKQGDITLSVRIDVPEFNLHRRIEQMRVEMKAKNGHGRARRYLDQFPLRTYDAAQTRRLLDQAPQFELINVFDFWYDIEDPLELNDEIEDTVLVLRKPP